MRKKGGKNKKYSPEFKATVILDMLENNLSYSETARKYWSYDIKAKHNHRGKLKLWERIYLEKGTAGLAIKQQGRKTKVENPNKGRPRKKPLDITIENDLIAENQRLKEELEYVKMENEYLKS